MHNLWVPSLSSAIETVLQLWINRWSMSLSSLARRHKLPVTSISQPYKHRLCLPLPQIAEGSNFCICSVSEKMNHDTLKPETRKIVSLLWSSIWFEVWHFGVVSPDHTLLCITTSAENAFTVSAVSNLSLHLLKGCLIFPNEKSSGNKSSEYPFTL